MRHPSIPVCIGAVLALSLALARTAAADPATPHFVFEPEKGAEGLAGNLARVAEDKRRYVLGILGVDDPRTIRVQIAADEESMSRVAGSGTHVSEWIAGMAFHSEDRIVISMRGNEFFHAGDTFVHELAHMYLDSAVAGHHVPRWFHEGFATMVASEELSERLKKVLAASSTGSLVPLEDLSSRFPSEAPAVHLAYAESMLFVRFLNRQKGTGGVTALVREVRMGMPFELAVEHVYGAPLATLWARFERQIDPTAGLVIFLTSTTVVWFVVAGLFVFVYVKKRRRADLKRRAMEIQDEIDQVRWGGSDAGGFIQ